MTAAEAICPMMNIGAFETRLTEQPEKAQLEIKLRFFRACEQIRNGERDSGIGTLGEKRLHASIKLFFEPEASKREVRLAGSVCDILNDCGIIEIQTRAFNKLYPKVCRFLDETDLTVTIVYPIPAVKRVIWLDPVTLEATSPRKSPKKGKLFDAFIEIYKLRELVCCDRVQILPMLIDMDEYRLLSGWSKDKKRGSERFERIPTSLSEAVLLTKNTYSALLLPKSLPREFTSADLAEHASIPLRTAQVAITVMSRCGAVVPTGRRGRLKLYVKK